MNVYKLVSVLATASMSVMLAAMGHPVLATVWGVGCALLAGLAAVDHLKARTARTERIVRALPLRKP